LLHGSSGTWITLLALPHLADRRQDCFTLDTIRFFEGVEQRFLNCNETFCDFPGYSEEELKQKTIALITGI
jgi:hypothetical protein